MPPALSLARYRLTFQVVDAGVRLPVYAGFRLAGRAATPLRLKVEGRHLTPAELRFSALFTPLRRRISLLTAFHTAAPLETDMAGAMDPCRQGRRHEPGLLPNRIELLLNSILLAKSSAWERVA